jgi:uncharacterized protein YdiU (UPF0061 family)
MSALPASGPLDGLHFDNTFTAELPADVESDNRRRQVAGACFSRVRPTPVRAPSLIAHSAEVADLVGIAPASGDVGANGWADALAQVFGGNQVLSGMDAHACCYGGHQFGNWAGQLGDGRAINLGEVQTPANGRWMLQLKGAGPTPYSRTADGLAVMRSSVREFLCSEAMHHLGVPTTRALSLVSTGEQVVRDMFYDGNQRPEPGAVVCRVAPTFTRFGNFELPASRGDVELLKQLADYTIRNSFPELGEPSRESTLAFFDEVCRRTADMIVNWMRVGFVHGVMNTDNMSILGLTIDYGPYGWLEGFDPDWTPNTTDAGGRRYRYGNQPQVALWNLVQLANALYPLVEDADALRASLAGYNERFESSWRNTMVSKLGLGAFDAGSDATLISDLTEVLQLTETDMTLFYRHLGALRLEQHLDGPEQWLAQLAPAYYEGDAPSGEAKNKTVDWLNRYAARIRSAGIGDKERCAGMNAVNPKYVLRNYIAQLAIDKAEEGDGSLVMTLLDVLRNPYDEQPEHEQYAARRPEWARHKAGCSMLSCSS